MTKMVTSGGDDGLDSGLLETVSGDTWLDTLETRGDVVGTELGLPGEGRLTLTLAFPAKK